MWAFTKPNAGPMGARNREQALPVAQDRWDEAPTPGSAPSTQKTRLPSAFRQAPSSTFTTARPDSAPVGSRSGAPALPPRPTSAVQARQSPSFSSAPVTYTPKGTPLSVNHLPGAARADKWMAQMRADGYMLSAPGSVDGSPSHKSMASPMSTLRTPTHKSMVSPMSTGQRTSFQDPGSCPQSLDLRRNRSAPNIEGPSQAESRENTPEQQKGWSGPGARRLRGSVCTSGRSKRKSDTPCPVKLGSQATTLAAFEADRLYQESLRTQWRREHDQKSFALQFQRRQTLQFFNFLRDPETNDLVEGGERFVPEQLAGDDSIQADWAQVEILSHAPDLDYSDVIEFDIKQLDFLRKVLRSFAMVSRPAGKVSRNLLDDGGPCADRLFRPTFSRFLIDARLVPGTGSSQPDGYQPYHRMVRIFDAVSRSNKLTKGAVDHRAFLEQVGPTLSDLRSVTTEQCISIVGALIGKSENPSSAIKNFFEKDLPEAWKSVQALLIERKERVEAAIKVVKADMLEEGYEKKKKEMTSLFGSPPTSYVGSMKDWMRGMKMWVQNIDEQGLPEAITERVESNFAVEHYLEDMLIEPGTIHVAQAYAPAFQSLFESYYDEERPCWISDASTRMLTESSKPHMSAGAFFRFCVDFSIYPSLGSFDEIRAAYAAAESADELPGIMEMERMKRRYKSPDALLAAMQGRSLSSACSEVAPAASLVHSNGDEDIEEDDAVFEDTEDARSRQSSNELEKGKLHRQISVSQARPSTATSRPKDQGATNGSPKEQSPECSPKLGRNSSKNWITKELLVPDGKDSPRSRQVSPRSPRSPKSPTGFKINVPSNAQLQQRRNSMKVSTAAEAVIAAGRGNVAAEAKAKAKADVATLEVHSASSRALRGKDGRGGASPRPSPRPSPRQPAKSPRQPTAHSSVQSSMSPTGSQDDFVRVKTCIDLSWIRKPFASMTEHERRAYALLSAFGNCAADRFLCVRGLFLSCSEGKELGLVNAAEIRRTIDKLKFDHDYTLEDMEAFVNVIDPKAEEGVVETAELEKAVGKVKIDQERRWPWLKDVGIGRTNQKGSSADWGDAARRHDDEDCWFHRDRKVRPVTAFGTAAFTETILRIGLVGLHGSGIAVQAAAPTGVKALYVISFLRFHYERLQEARLELNFDALDPKLHAEKGKRMEGQSQSIPSSQVSTRPGTAASRPDTASSNPPRPLTSPASGQHWTSAYFAQRGSSTSVPRPAAEQSRPSAAAGTTPFRGGKRQAEPVPEEEPPSGAKYKWALNRLLDKYPDAFNEGVYDNKKLCPDDPPYIVNPYRAFELCSKCNRSRNNKGRGNIFCHDCSGIDDGPLSKSVLFPVCQRRRLKLKMAQYDPSAVYSSAKDAKQESGLDDESLGDLWSRACSKASIVQSLRANSKVSMLSGKHSGDDMNQSPRPKENQRNLSPPRSPGRLNSRRASNASGAQSLASRGVSNS